MLRSLLLLLIVTVIGVSAYFFVGGDLSGSVETKRVKLLGVQSESEITQIQSELKLIKGVNGVRFNMDSQILEVQFKSNKTNFNNISKKINKMGYKVMIEPAKNELKIIDYQIQFN